MRNWYLGAGDPLNLTLAADFRLGELTPGSDIAWEVELGGGDPPALAARTTYGLRARAARIFPRFLAGGQALAEPARFPAPPRLRRFAPNFLLFHFSPLAGIEVDAEFWVPSSQTLAGRFGIANHSENRQALALDLCAQLAPVGGRAFSPLLAQTVNILAGRTSDLSPVVFLTGGPRPGPGPYPSLAVDLVLPPGGSRQLTWAHAALPDQQASFELARRTAARPWEAERARLELLNASQTVEVACGDQDWDAAFAFSQKAAFSLFFPACGGLPRPSFVTSRRPDQAGAAPGREFPPHFDGQSLFDALHLSDALAGAPQLAEGLLENFLAAMREDGFLPCKSGADNPAGRWLAPPLLAGLAWKVYGAGRRAQIPDGMLPRLRRFLEAWDAPEHDRDRDGFPEWDHPLQAGLEDHPLFDPWQPQGQGLDIATVETPILAAMLQREYRLLAEMAGQAGVDDEREALSARAEACRALVESTRAPGGRRHLMRDRDAHASPAGRTLARKRGSGLHPLKLAFERPQRLLLQLLLASPASQPRFSLRGRADGKAVREEVARASLQWAGERAFYTTRHCYTRLAEVRCQGLGRNDRFTLAAPNLAAEDLACRLASVRETPGLAAALLPGGRLLRPFGVLQTALPQEAPVVRLPWNRMLGEALLENGMRVEAAALFARLMAGIVANLKGQRAFYAALQGETGAGLGEREALAGLAPLGLFLDVLGVRFAPGGCVELDGSNPFPWPVTVKYRGLAVTRREDQTEIVFPDGQALAVDDPSRCLVCPQEEQP
ncbi:MAG: hypothetical protein FJZ96_05255 [Chloroflexi bacterium]|nr:hypothetical protein [Chloroflexota bacterium]